MLASVLPTLERLFFLPLFTLHSAAKTARLEFFYTKALYEQLREQYNSRETPPTCEQTRHASAAPGSSADAAAPAERDDARSTQAYAALRA